MTSPRPPATLPFLLLILLAIPSARGEAIRTYSVTDLGANEFTQLNDLGEAIGRSGDRDSETRDQLLYTGGRVENLGQSISLRRTNSRGQMIALLPSENGFEDFLNNRHAIREPDGTIRPIVGLESGEVPVAINASGQILVGRRSDNTTRTYSILTDGQRQSAQLPHGYGDPFSASAFGPNGEVAGYYRRDDGKSFMVAFVPGDPNFYFLTAPASGGGAGIAAYNNVGQLLYGGFNSFGFHLDSNDFMTLIRGDLPLWPNGLNDASEIVGSAMLMRDPFGNSLSGTSAVILIGDLATDLNALLSTEFVGHLDDALAINNLGQILATGKLGGETHSFLLTPQAVPEPASWLVALAVLIGASLRRASRDDDD